MAQLRQRTKVSARTEQTWCTPAAWVEPRHEVMAVDGSPSLGLVLWTYMTFCGKGDWARAGVVRLRNQGDRPIKGLQSILEGASICLLQNFLLSLLLHVQQTGFL